MIVEQSLRHIRTQYSRSDVAALSRARLTLAGMMIIKAVIMGSWFCF
jgi:hypothetical protein